LVGSLTLKAQAKTPQQRKANALFEKREAAKRGQPVQPKQEVKKAPISKYWIGTQFSKKCDSCLAALIFVTVGGGILELIRVFFSS
jgi:hypothetical protein